jgi:uroporphyrinogen-III synthase
VARVNAPLAGLNILVTRSREQARDLSEKLAELGACPIEFPTIQITPLEDTTHLDEAVRRVMDYDWVIFTSVNGVMAFWDRLLALGLDRMMLDGVRVAAIGPATARALTGRGIQLAFMPAEFVAERIAEGLGEVSGLRILLPRAEIARKALVEQLAARGAQVDEVTAYRTLLAPVPADLDLDRVDLLTFTSSSTVRNFVAICQQANLRLPAQARVACIGPITARTAQELGLRVDVVASQYTMDGLVEAIVSME